MIALRRASERRHVRHHRRDVWHTEPSTDGFQALERIEEDRLLPRSSVPSLEDHPVEIVTYVREGALGYDDGSGYSAVLHAGEFQRTTGVRAGATHMSRTQGAQLFRTWLRPSGTGLGPSHEQKHFSVAERRGLLRVVASPDARDGSLHVHADAFLYSAMLDPGQHVVHELTRGRAAWLHVVEGEGALADLVLTEGDGAGLWAERSLSFTAHESTEILLVDLGEHTPPPPRGKP